DEVVARPAVQVIDLCCGLTAGFVVAPDHVAGGAGVDRVVSVSAEQLVVPDIGRHHSDLAATARAQARRLPMQAVARITGVGSVEEILSWPGIQRSALIQ